MAQLPDSQHITYQLQFRKCGKPTCSTCREGQGHGPYWYAYWREGSRLRSGYIGNAPPVAETSTEVVTAASPATRSAWCRIVFRRTTGTNPPDLIPCYY